MYQFIHEQDLSLVLSQTQKQICQWRANIQQITCSVASHTRRLLAKGLVNLWRDETVHSANSAALLWREGLREREMWVDGLREWFVHLKYLFKRTIFFTNVTSLESEEWADGSEWVHASSHPTCLTLPHSERIPILFSHEDQWPSSGTSSLVSFGGFKEDVSGGFWCGGMVLATWRTLSSSAKRTKWCQAQCGHRTQPHPHKCLWRAWLRMVSYIRACPQLPQWMVPARAPPASHLPEACTILSGRSWRTFLVVVCSLLSPHLLFSLRCLHLH